MQETGIAVPSAVNTAVQIRVTPRGSRVNRQDPHTPTALPGENTSPRNIQDHPWPYVREKSPPQAAGRHGRSQPGLRPAPNSAHSMPAKPGDRGPPGPSGSSSSSLAVGGGGWPPASPTPATGCKPAQPCFSSEVVDNRKGRRASPILLQGHFWHCWLGWRLLGSILDTHADRCTSFGYPFGTLGVTRNKQLLVVHARDGRPSCCRRGIRVRRGARGGPWRDRTVGLQWHLCSRTCTRCWSCFGGLSSLSRRDRRHSV